MEEFIKLLDENLEYISHEIKGDTIYINVKSIREQVQCPFCGHFSSRVHSSYSKSFQDLPIFVLFNIKVTGCLVPID